MAPDARTTHRWLQIPVLLFMGLLVFYLSTANLWALKKNKKHAPDWVRSFPSYTWFGGWKMFTGRDPGHSMIVAQAKVEGKWQKVKLEKLFPTHWESGPRYARSWFRDSRWAMKTLAQATCGRLESQQEIRAAKVRFHLVRWKKKLGDRRQRPPKKAWKKKRLVPSKDFVWDCSRTHKLPQGQRLDLDYLLEVLQ